MMLLQSKDLIHTNIYMVIKVNVSCVEYFHFKEHNKSTDEMMRLHNSNGFRNISRQIGVWSCRFAHHRRLLAWSAISECSPIMEILIDVLP